MKRTERIGVRLSLEELKTLKEVCTCKGLSLSVLIRESLKEAKNENS